MIGRPPGGPGPAIVPPEATFDESPARPLPLRAWQSAVRRAAASWDPGRMIVRGPSGSVEAALSFDDGPHPEHTPKLLDALAEHSVAATFFVVGDRARRHPGLVRRMRVEGHAVGLHSFSHPLPRRGSERRDLDEALEARAVVADILGGATDLYRPPYGWVTARGLRMLWDAGLRVVLWNVDPKDYARGTAEEVLAWFRDRPPGGGDLILLHDDRPIAAAVVGPLAAARERGLGFARVDDWSGRSPRA